ncbi:MAG: glycosyltransferase [Syntrophobacterales bacterium]|nr:glycosyltransferase [Syntrophobacterales bacterium]
MLLVEEQLIPYQPSDLPEGPFLVVAPHPDDESFGMGGTIALATQQGIEVFVVVVTDGSHGGDRETRYGEALRAAEVLGIKKVFFLDIEDRRVNNFSSVLRRELSKIISFVKPKTVFLPSLFELNPDHRAVTFISWEVIRERGFDGGVWLYEIVKQGEVNRLIDITPVIDTKRRAIRVYESQIKYRAYEEIVLSINRARSFTLPEEARYAEGFFCLHQNRDLFDVIVSTRRYFGGLERGLDLPIVSIIVRTKDRPSLLRETMESLARQSYPKVEAIVVNDGGEEVKGIIDEFKNSIHHVIYIRHELSKGRAKAANVGLKLANGEWVGLLDDDDLLEDSAIGILGWYGRTSSVVYGQVELVEPLPDGTKRSLGLFGREFSREALFINNYIPICGLLFRRELALEIGGFDESFDRLEDWDFIYRLACRKNFLYVPHRVATYRSFGGQAFVFRQDFSEEFFWRRKFYEKHLGTINPDKLTKCYFDFVSFQYKDFIKISQQLAKEQEEKQHLLEGWEREKKEREDEKRQLITQLEQEKRTCREQLEKEKELYHILQQRLSSLEVEKEALRKAFYDITQSRSWRVTAPLRWISQMVRKTGKNMATLLELLNRFILYCRTIGFYATVLKTFHWIKKRVFKRGKVLPHSTLSPEKAREILEKLSYRPLISIVMPVFDPKPSYLIEALESVARQYYENWELCIVDDASRNVFVRKVLQEFSSRFPEKVKLRFREINGHIVKASNDGISMATGEFIAFLDHDDELSPDALLEIVRVLNDRPDLDMIYSDEDKIRPDGSYGDPFFKPNWAPELILGEMFTCHLGVYRREIVEKVGGLREGFEGSQDWDLVLRISEVTEKIYHVPKILYHWRMHGGSTAMDASHKTYAEEAARRAVVEALQRRGDDGIVESVAPGRHLVRYRLRGEPFISIIIPTRDLAYDLDRNITSLHHKSTYERYEIVVVDNGSREKKTFDTFGKWQGILGSRFRVITCNEPFNFSRLVNLGVVNSRGDLILLLNNDMELITPTDWLQEMAAYAQKEPIGCVGAVLLYPNDTIQHGGVILGISPNPACPGVAGHAFKCLPANHPGYFDRLRVVSNWSAVTGACLMVRRDLWDRVGGFDESLSVAFNDIDFCLKLLVKGYRHVVLPHVRLYHYESKSRGYEDTVDKQRRFSCEIEIMRNRWAYLLDNDPYYNPQLPKNREDFGLM